ncbi:DUF6904 family protein [Acidaminobacter sp.]|uniref:DUF6904 family protein n=1 Tax=Acidaminobacter sp. TaxID=1872102 RepID=UPI0025600D36|nr:hypothetical protein [Acidaminobacter sp.]MDK9712137.1 hypothetical protein [Acidaminobacter sp.]
MIKAELTPRHAGIAIAGDYEDLDQLYDALIRILGDEDEYPAYAAARIGVLGLCYDIRHAYMGDRDIKVIDNNMTREKMKLTGKVVHTTNVYYEFQVLMPEILFIVMALNDFCLLRARKESKLMLDPMRHKKIIWDLDIAQIRMLQSAIFDCLARALEPRAVTRLLNLMIQDYPWMDGYFTQYLDELNVEILEMDQDKRLKFVTVLAKRLTELDAPDYLGLRHEVKDYAKAMGIAPDEVRLNLDYPDVEW